VIGAGNLSKAERFSSWKFTRDKRFVCFKLVLKLKDKWKFFKLNFQKNR